MCLLVFAYKQHSRYPFLFAANRDERHERPTRQAHFWDDYPQILAGRDEQAGGTWCGITRNGRFAALSNYREPASNRPDAPSRGFLVSEFLDDTRPPAEYLDELQEKASAYNGFNLLMGDLKQDVLYYFSNRNGPLRRLTPGIYGLSNHLLDTPWPKVSRSKERLAEIIEKEENPRPEGLFEILGSTDPPPVEKGTDTDVDDEMQERLPTVPFIVHPVYGTRSSTLIYLDRMGVITFIERTYDPGGTAVGMVEYEFSLER